ncbi:MAG: hypothetical protein FJW20_19940 [Acidimicrobiia bacterium]|nr:hypothetical protein [Acidimicrobiia bacterium]
MILVRFLLAAICLAGALAGAQLKNWSRRHNLTLLEFESGRGELEWITSSTFRFQRCPTASCPSRPSTEESVEFSVRRDKTGIEWRTVYLEVRLDAGSGAISVHTREGKPLLLEAAAKSLFAREVLEAERLYGLGPHTRAAVDLRGSKISSTRPLLISSAGFGQYFPAPADYEFDLAHSDPKQIQVSAPFARHLEYFFYYGPAPKEILEEHRNVAGVVGPVDARLLDVRTPETLPSFAVPLTTLAQIPHAGFSGMPLPAYPLRIAAESAIGPFLPLLYREDEELLPASVVVTRRRFSPFLHTYLQEARDRGLPVLRALPMQYSRDPEAARHGTQMMAGDELLLPTSDSLYLPMGLWTDLCSGERFSGRRVIAVEIKQHCPVFARNGSIVPVDAGTHMELHYFPRLGAEFFLAESGSLYSQFHAAPAGDYLRLEIESKAAREYEWAVHHVSAPVEISPRRAHRYEHEKGELRIRMQVPARSTSILNISLKEPL